MFNSNIALIDDEVYILDALDRLLKHNFRIFKFNDPQDFFTFIKNHPEIEFAVIMTDQKMPTMLGTELLAQSQIYQPWATRILLTGYSDLESVIDAINQGQIYRYLHKPWEPNDLITTVTEAAQKYQLIMDNQKKTRDLAIANAELQTLDQSKNQFMILINHELKTPITAILNFAELLWEDMSLNAEQRNSVQQILKNTTRLYEMIQATLIITSAEAQLLKPNIQPFQSSQLDLNVSDRFVTLMRNKQITLNFELDPDIKIIGDDKLISQILRRLIENAIRFGYTQSIITVKSVRKPAHRVLFCVTNQGPPVSQKTLDNLGRPFFLDEDILRHSQGTGLGLSVVTTLLKLHNSRLNLINHGNAVDACFELSYL